MFSGLKLAETEIYRRLIFLWERGYLNGSEGSEPSRSWMLRYGCALFSVALATWVRFLLDPVLGNQTPYPALLFAVLVTVWYTLGHHQCGAATIAEQHSWYRHVPFIRMHL
jgi:hypothetical protein